jgi:hypothetical protein
MVERRVADLIPSSRAGSSRRPHDEEDLPPCRGIESVCDDEVAGFWILYLGGTIADHQRGAREKSASKGSQRLSNLAPRSNFRLCCFCNSCLIMEAVATQQHGVGFRFHFFEFLKPQFRSILLIVSVWRYYNQLGRVQRPGALGRVVDFTRRRHR